MVQLMLASGFDPNRQYKNTIWGYQEKFDGIRCAIYEGECNRHNVAERVFSRSGKRIPNHFIRFVLGDLPSGLDGELIVQNGNFQEVTTACMTEDGQPENWQYMVFDYFGEPELPKSARLEKAKELIEQWKADHEGFAFVDKVAFADWQMGTIDDAHRFCQQIVEQGGEGAMIFDMAGEYVHRRARTTESLLLKLKPFADAEGDVIGIEYATYSGYTNVLREQAEFKKYAKLKPTQMKRLLSENPDIAERVQSYIGKPKQEIGSLIVQCGEFEHSFGLGTGFTQAQRIEFGKNPPIGKLVKFKYLQCGTKDRPRNPVFLGLRHEDDL